MEWESWLWVGDAPSVESLAEHVDGAASLERPLADRAGGHLLELWLVACAYEYVAAGTLCTRCPNPLGDDTRMFVDPDGGVASGLVISTRCRGRQRHRHIATVTERSGDLVLGGFERRSNRRRLRRSPRDPGATLDTKRNGRAGDVA